jgi:ribosomal protein L32
MDAPALATSTCPSCGRFVGPAEKCPHCGAALHKRLPLRLVKYASIPLALLGILARNGKVTTLATVPE